MACVKEDCWVEELDITELVAVIDAIELVVVGVVLAYQSGDSVNMSVESSQLRPSKT